MGLINGLKLALLLLMFTLANYLVAASEQPTQESIQVERQTGKTKHTAYELPCYTGDAIGLSFTRQVVPRRYKPGQILVGNNANAAYPCTGTCKTF